MYVETMTFAQIAKEIKKDRFYLESKIGYVLGDSKYRRACLKLKDKAFHSFERVDFTSKETGIEYHLIPYVLGKRDFIKNSLGFSVFLTFRKHNRVWAGFMYDNVTKIAFFTPHFFDRYEEREGKDSTSRLDLMTSFFTRNRAFNHTDYSHPEHPKSQFVTMDEGVGLGTKLEGSLLLVTTYVSNEMLYDSQTGIQLAGKRLVDECFEKFSKGKKHSYNAA